MANILSQKKIDELLNAVASGAIDKIEGGGKSKRRYTRYDFRRPKLISKDQKRTTRMLYDSFTKSYATALSLYLRTNVKIDLTRIEQFTYGEYIMSLPDTTCINVFSMMPLEGHGIFEINLETIFAIIDRLLGGTGGTYKAERELTAVERAIVSNIVNMGLEKMEEAWLHIMKLDCSLEWMDSRPRLSQIIGLTNNVLLMQFEIEIGNTTSSMSICIPFESVIPILSKLSAQQWMASAANVEGKNTKANQQLLPDVETEITVELGSARLSIQELIELKQDTILVLDKTAADPAVVKIGGVCKFYGKPGIVANRRGVLIQQEI